MVWKADDPQGNESGKVRWELVPYTRGRGLDLGCGPFITFPHFIRVDNCVDEQLFGIRIQPNIKVETCEKLDMFGSGSMDFVFSSHLLEHFDESVIPRVLREWARVVKPGGHLILYVPDEDEYPKVGQSGANPDHKVNINYDSVIKWMSTVPRGWDLIRFEKRAGGQEYSLFFVFKVLH